MINCRRASIVAVLLLLFVSASLAGSSMHAVWIEVTKKNNEKTVIAVTDDVMRAVLASDVHNTHFTDGNNKDLITRKMLQDVLSGERRSIDVADEDENVHIYAAKLDVPSHGGKEHQFVVETYEHGERTFRMSLGDFNIESSERNGESSSFSLNWRKILPFLKNTDGAIYMQNEEEGTSVWVYLD